MIVQCALLTKGDVKAAGYWPRSFLIFFLTETKSRQLKTHNTLKEQGHKARDLFKEGKIRRCILPTGVANQNTRFT